MVLYLWVYRLLLYSNGDVECTECQRISNEVHCYFEEFRVSAFDPKRTLALKYRNTKKNGLPDYLPEVSLKI